MVPRFLGHLLLLVASGSPEAGIHPWQAEVRREVCPILGWHCWEVVDYAAFPQPGVTGVYWGRRRDACCTSHVPVLQNKLV